YNVRNSRARRLGTRGATTQRRDVLSDEKMRPGSWDCCADAPCAVTRLRSPTTDGCCGQEDRFRKNIRMVRRQQAEFFSWCVRKMATLVAAGHCPALHRQRLRATAQAG